MHFPSATSCHTRRALRLALLIGAAIALPNARASGQGAHDIDSMAVAPGVRMPARMRGASRAVVDSAEVRRAAALTFSELLQARAASVNVMMSGGRQVDGGQLLIRGPSTLGTNGAPLLIVDGMRMDEREDDIVGTTSRIDDVAIDDIATVEVLRGPSAAALYGSGASSGVIVVTTRRGQLGWSAHLRAAGEALRDGGSYAELYRRRSVGGVFTGSCPLEFEKTGACVPGPVDQWRPIADAGLLRTGVGALASFDVAHGTAQRDARLSLTLRRGSGISAGDALSRLSTRLNATQRVGTWLELTGHASYVGDRTEDSKFGAVIDGQNDQSVGPTPVDSFAKWATSQLGTAMGGRLDHLTTGVDVAVRPMQRLTLRAALSRDHVDEGAGYVGAPVLLPPAFTGALGDTFVEGPFAHVSGWSTDREARVTAEYSVPLSVEEGAELLLVAGSERDHRTRDEGQSTGMGGSFASTESWRSFANDAHFALARLQVLDRFAASAGLRRERDGGVAGNGYHAYPMADLAIRPATRILRGDLQLRAAYGESTQRLATFQAFPDLSRYPPYGYPYPYPGGFGPPPDPIGPETMRETEGGVDLGWGSRGAISLTAYHRALRNMLPNSTLPSLSFQVRQPLSLSSSGVEADARATVVERGSMRWSLRAIVATNRNRVTTPNVVPYSFDDGFASDQPIGVAMRRPYSFNDVNGDGVAEFREVGGGQAAIDTLRGSTPTLAVALHSELALGRRLTVGVIVDRRSGAWTRSSVATSRCGGPEVACREMQDPATPFDAQATAVENLFVAPGTGNTFDASFTRLREVSLRWALPVGRVAALGASGARVTVAGRDLATWTKWPGTDPEVSSLLRSAVTRDDGSAVPLPRRLIVGLELDY